MHQTDHQQHGLAIHQGQTKIIQIGNQIYQLSEIQAQPLAVNPQSVNPPIPTSAPAPVPYQPQPTAIYPTALPPQGNEWSWQTIALLGMGLLIVTGFGTFLVVKAALPPAVPAVAPPAPAPAPAPQTVIVQPPPPPPPPQPFSEEICRPGGFMQGEICTRRTGYR